LSRGRCGTAVSARPTGPGRDSEIQFRDELNGHLASAITIGFPWRDLTEIDLVELPVNSMSRWPPRAEAVVLRRSFAAETDRPHDVADWGRPEVWGANF
jgi:hypothetical protein